MKYLGDPNFTFFVETAKKYGFMVDKNAPWRIVFNVASGYEAYKEAPEKLQGAQKYMDAYGCNFENIFETYYIESHLEDMESIKDLILSFYQTYYSQFPTYETIKYPAASWRVKTTSGGCTAISVKSVRKDRDPPPVVLGTKEQVDEYWLRILLKLRLVETGVHHDSQSLPGTIREMINIKRIMGTDAASNYINDLTKGSLETKFIRKGKYWYGVSNAQYKHRLEEARKNARGPLRVDYALIGTKGKK
jgi:hypothetical protein